MLKPEIEKFVKRLNANGNSPHTVSSYQRELLMFAGVISDRYPSIGFDEITPAILDDVFTSKAVMEINPGQQKATASLHRFKAVVRSFFSWAELEGAITSNPARFIKLTRISRTPPDFLTEAEKRLLQKELRSRTSSIAIRDRVIIELFLGTGIRVQELVDIDIDDIDLDAKHLRIRAKGNIFQIKFLKTNLRTLLRSYLAERRRQSDSECPALFLSNRQKRISTAQVSNRLKYWLAKAGIDKDLGPHGLRHTFATHLYSKTNDILIVQKALGHKDLSSTQIYTHLVDSQLEDALERL